MKIIYFIVFLIIIFFVIVITPIIYCYGINIDNSNVKTNSNTLFPTTDFDRWCYNCKSEHFRNTEKMPCLVCHGYSKWERMI